MIDDYEINSSTLALIPIGANESLVMEEEESYTVGQKSSEIIDHSCKYFGSSLKGRYEGASNLLGFSYKVPIIIEESRDIIFFPTASIRSLKCYWISLNHVLKYEAQGKDTLLTFKNGKKITIQISKYSFENQILRASRLGTILSKRKINVEQ